LTSFVTCQQASLRGERLASSALPAVCVTVIEGATVIVNGRAVHVDDSATLSSILELVLTDPAQIHRVDGVQEANTISGTRFDANLEDEVGLHLEFERRFFSFACAWRRQENPSTPGP
jgi:hypothetical protein